MDPISVGQWRQAHEGHRVRRLPPEPAQDAGAATFVRLTLVCDDCDERFVYEEIIDP